MTNETQTQTRTMTQTYALSASLETVFKALTDPATIQTWWSSKAVLEPRVGGRFLADFQFDDAAKNMTMDTKVLGFEAGRRVAISWATPFGVDTEVEFLLAADGDGTTLTMNHTGFGSGEGWDEYYPKIEGGWQYYLGNLKTVLEDGNDQRVGTGQHLAS